jgi:ubiquinol-cytochrome c reductase cytochrome c subunit
MRTVLILALFLAFAAPALAADGKSLFDANCSKCHGSLGEGLAGKGPSLIDAGALGGDFYIRTGYMPLAAPHAQPARTRVLFTEPQISALVAYVASLGRGPSIPSPHWQAASVAAGQKLFADHCAGCHQIVARGGVVTGARVPALDQATARQIAEAIRIGPYLMPRFSARTITPTQVNDIVAYVEYAKHPDNAGGWSIGDLGPWPEGMVTWLLAAAVLVAMCRVFGRRART